MMPNETTSRPGAGGARDFLAVLFRRRWIIGTVFAVTTLTVVAINLTRPLFWESTGKVILKRGEKDNLLQPGMQRARARPRSRPVSNGSRPRCAPRSRARARRVATPGATSPRITE